MVQGAMLARAINQTRLTGKFFTGKVVSVLFALIFCAYWLITVVFTFPESSVVIGENYHMYNKFNSYFYQQWSFFAPPPKSNRKLTYSYFYMENNVLKRTEVEVFDNIFEDITRHYPFNDVYINFEWMFYAKTDQIQDVIRRYVSVKKIENFKEEADRKAIKSIVYQSKAFAFILDHAVKLQRKLDVPDNARVQIMISDVPINKYKDRYKSSASNPKEYFFVSDLYNIKQAKWES